MTVGIVLVLVGAALLVWGRIKGTTPARRLITGDPAALVVIIIGVVCVAYAFAFTRSSSKTPVTAASPSVEVTALISPTATVGSTRPAPTGPVVTMDRLPVGTVIGQKKGLIATGTATDLGTNTVWILDYDGGYTVDDEATVTGTRWRAADLPLGDSTDPIPFTVTVKTVLANPACATALAKLNTTVTDYTKTLPAGCTVVGSITGTVTTR